MFKKYFNHALATGVFVATASVASAQTLELSTGITKVRLDPTFAATVGPITTANKPGRLRGTTAKFPVTGGAVDTADLRGEVLHRGGLNLACASDVKLIEYIINTAGPTPVISGLVVVDDGLLGRVDLFDLDLAGLQVSSYGDYLLKLSNIGVTLTDGAATTLNGVCGTSFDGNTVVGTASSYIFPERQRSFGWGD
jgi:hypothetical protein